MPLPPQGAPLAAGRRMGTAEASDKHGRTTKALVARLRLQDRRGSAGISKTRSAVLSATLGGMGGVARATRTTPPVRCSTGRTTGKVFEEGSPTAGGYFVPRTIGPLMATLPAGSVRGQVVSTRKEAKQGRPRVVWPRRSSLLCFEQSLHVHPVSTRVVMQRFTDAW